MRHSIAIVLVTCLALLAYSQVPPDARTERISGHAPSAFSDKTMPIEVIDITHLDVASVSIKRLDSFAGIDIHSYPVQYCAPSYVMSIVGSLEEPVEKIRAGAMHECLLDNGQNLLEIESREYPIRSLSLRANGRLLEFDLELPIPPRDASSFKRISGTLRSSARRGEKTVDLGMGSLEVGAEGKKYAAKVSSMGPGPWDKEGQTIQVILSQLKEPLIKRFRFFDENGEEIDVRGNWLLDEANGIIYVTYVCARGRFPTKGSIHLVMYEEVTYTDYKFELTDLSFFGDPLPRENDPSDSP